MRGKVLVLGVASVLFLVSCGGDNDGLRDRNHSTTASSSEPGEVVINDVQATPQTISGLILATDHKLAKHVKNGMRVKLLSDSAIENPTTAYHSSFIGFSSSQPSANALLSPVVVSEKSNFPLAADQIVRASDEGLALFDGDYWFIATHPFDERYRADDEPGINIFAPSSVNAKAQFVTKIRLDSKAEGADKMYLLPKNGQRAKRIIAIQDVGGAFSATMPGYGFPQLNTSYYFEPRDGQVRLHMFNVENAADPVLELDMTIEGRLLDSHKVDNKLYLITEYEPWLEGLTFKRGEDQVGTRNKAIFDKATLSDMMPNYAVAGGVSGVLTDSCYIQQDAQDLHGVASFVHITEVDLNTKQVVASTCVNSLVELFYMGEESLYLTGTLWRDDYSAREGTVIHKFSLTEQSLEYAATGSVGGYLAHLYRPSRFDEHDGDLRVLTRSEPAAEDLFWILEQRAARLEVVSQLPNVQRPEPLGGNGLGMSGLNLHGVSGYFTPLRQTDSILSLDLNDRLDPKASERVTVPKSATNAYTINERYMFAFGRGSRDTDSIKVALWDMSGSVPKEVMSFNAGIGYVHSEALSNLKALGVSAVSEDVYRFSLPIEVYEIYEIYDFANNNYVRDRRWQNTGLYLYEVTGLLGDNPVLSEKGVLISDVAESNEYYPPYHGHDRSLILEDAVFFSYQNTVFSAFWNSPESIENPFNSPLDTCGDSVARSFDVSLSAEGIIACDVKVVATHQRGEAFDLPVLSGEGEQCTFAGPDEMVGTFTIKATHEGYNTIIKEITVLKNACHVQTQYVDLNANAYRDFNEVCSFEGEAYHPLQGVVLHTRGEDKDFFTKCPTLKAEMSQDGVVYPLVNLRDYSYTPDPLSPGERPKIQCFFHGARGVSGNVDIKVSNPATGEVIEENGVLIKRTAECAITPLDRSYELLME